VVISGETKRERTARPPAIALCLQIISEDSLPRVGSGDAALSQQEGQSVVGLFVNAEPLAAAGTENFQQMVRVRVVFVVFVPGGGIGFRIRVSVCLEVEDPVCHGSEATRWDRAVQGLKFA
jgi:hypothetical protein